MLPVIRILLFNETPLRAPIAAGRLPTVIQAEAPSIRVSVDARFGGLDVPPEDPPVTRYT